MKIENIREEENGNKKRIAATIRWENSNRKTEDIYFETDESFAQDLTCNPHAFLVACTIPAMHYGEKRIWLDAEICPKLRTGLEVAMGWLRQWYYKPDHELVHIETNGRSELQTEKSNAERAGVFFSGGIDSLSTLRANRINFPLNHPWSIKDGIIIYGLELDDPEKFEYVIDSLYKLSLNLGIGLIPVYTNIYLIYRDEDRKTRFSFWYYKFMGAALAAVAHALSRRFDLCFIAGDYDIPNQQPHGSHPLLDPNYSSADLRIRHDGINLSRYEKTRLVAGWDVALQNLRVCNQYKTYQKGMLNCGKCEKCIRTMLALLALGFLDKTKVFPYDDISAEMIRSIVKLNYSTVPLYRELIAPLKDIDRSDLIDVINYKIKEYDKQQKREYWVEQIKKFDSKYLHNFLLGFKRSLPHR